VRGVAGDEHAAFPICVRHIVAPLPGRHREHLVGEDAARHLAQQEVRIGDTQRLVEHGEAEQLLAVDRDQLAPAAGLVDHAIKTRPALVVERGQFGRAEEQIDAVGDDAEPFELDAQLLPDHAGRAVAAHEIACAHAAPCAGGRV
jgi:hypothetical protein